ncbi:MAG TPA: Mur ligase family protein, partial [Nevskiaceae bacterium]|nr:Mur ligase family protein [Nevskiaceae bacterium]
KGELYQQLDGGVAVINADDVYAPLWRGFAGRASIITFGFDEHADVRASNAQPHPANSPTGTRFTLHAQEGRVGVTLPLPGRHNVSNALAAAACAVALGMDLADIAAGLARTEAAAGRVNWRQTPEGARLLDDSYNANPTSLEAGMQLLAGLPGERWLILGSMAELGADAPRLHLEAGKRARELGIERLMGMGTLAAEAVKGFGPGASWFDDAHALADAARARLSPNVAVLVKGSRSARMERVVAALCGTTVSGGH